MNDPETLKFLLDTGKDGLLLLVLWQGLKRFDRLLDLVIALAARSKLSSDEVEQLRAQVFRRNGTVK
jgi:hypothetical protein